MTDHSLDDLLGQRFKIVPAEHRIRHSQGFTGDRVYDRPKSFTGVVSLHASIYLVAAKPENREIAKIFYIDRKSVV